MNDLLTQLNALIANAEANQAAADNWHNLVAMLAERGYGPRITPAQVASVCIDFTDLLALVASTQEVRTPEATKSMPRRKLTDDDKQWIDQAVAAGNTPKQIARQFGLSLAAVNAYLNHE